MSSITRNLLPFAVKRQSAIPATLVFFTRAESDDYDGSFVETEVKQQVKGFFVTLTEDEIQRLVTDGITISRGAVLSLPFELKIPPDHVLYDRGRMRGRVVKYTIAEGMSSLTLEIASTGLADVLP